MFDQLNPQLVGVVKCGRLDAETQIIELSLEPDNVLKIKFKAERDDVELSLKLGHTQVALNEMITKQNQIVREQQQVAAQQ